MNIKPVVKRRYGRGGIILSIRQKKISALLAVLIFILLFVAGRLKILPKTTPADQLVFEKQTFMVINVVDGDTIDLDAPDGSKTYTRVRLWGVDTPETKHPEMGVMYYGPEASEFTKKMVLHKKITVALEPFEKSRDKYGRLLAYIYLEGEGQNGEKPKMLNTELIAQGYGYADERFKHIFDKEFIRLQKEAQKQKRGLWKEVQPEQFPEWYSKRHQEKKGRI